MGQALEYKHGTMWTIQQVEIFPNAVEILKIFENRIIKKFEKHAIEVNITIIIIRSKFKNVYTNIFANCNPYLKNVSI